MFNNITLNNALPSKECYHVFQDPKGYIWIATELGLCRLDGKNIKIFNSKNGLPEGAIYTVKQHGDKIWMVSSKNRILTLENGQIKTFRLSNTYQNLVDANEEFTYAIHFSKQISLNSKWNTYIADTLKNAITKVPKELTEASLYLNSEGLIPYNALLPTPTKYINVIIDLDGKPKKTLKIPFKGFWSYRFLSCKVSNSYFFSYNNQLIKINPDLSFEIYDMPDNISCLYVDNDKDLWVGLYKKGVLYYPKGNIKNPIKGLVNYSISSIYQDREKNIWCTTLEKGVFIAKSKMVINYTDKFGDIYTPSLLKAFGNKTFLMKGTELYAIDSIGNLENKPHLNYKATDTLAATFKNHHDFLKKETLSDLIRVDKHFYAISYVFISKIGNQLSNHRISSPGRSIAHLNNKTLIFGCNDGIYHFNIETTKEQKIVPTPSRVTKIFITSKKDCLVATKGHGVFYLKENKLIPYGIPSEIVYDITEDQHGNMWFATNKGLLKKSAHQTIFYTVLHGLPSNEIYKLTINHGRVYFLTSEGLASFPIVHNLQNEIPMQIHLQSASVGPMNINFTKLVKLHYHQNSLNIKINALSFKNDEKQLKYKLIPSDTSFHFTSSNAISLENLSPNKYSLIIYGVNSDGTASSPLNLSFIIDSPFWQKWWFILPVFIFVLLIISLIIKALAKKIRNKEKEKTRINKLIAENQLAALQAQMNPHFVFNCINSIQKYILKKEEKKAYDYLANFSKLIRLVLHHAQDKSVSLHNELELLNLYVSLEQLRFKDGFEYVTEIDEALDTHNILIPSMLLQPYIENAIWHGLMNLDKGKKGILLLKIKQAENSILITIEDNGVGRKQAMAYKVDNLHRPVAVNLNQQRINVLNQMYKKDSFSAEITDKYDELGNAKGTIVSILLPLNYE